MRHTRILNKDHCAHENATISIKLTTATNNSHKKTLVIPRGSTPLYLDRRYIKHNERQTLEGRSTTPGTHPLFFPLHRHSICAHRFFDPFSFLVSCSKEDSFHCGKYCGAYVCSTGHEVPCCDAT